jgi:chemotaxis protein methyltransferase CheR
MPDLRLTPQVFSILSSLVAETFGLHFDNAHLQVFEEKVAARAAEAGFDSLLDYYYFLRYDERGSAELSALIDTLVVGETYLFRELAPLEMMIAEFVIPALSAGRRPRIWSAACATGEEPHTVALLLASRGLLDDVDLVASDISATALERARSGRFSRRALRQEIPAFAARWLETQAATPSALDQRVVVQPRLTRAIDWRRINLVEDAGLASLGTFDVVLCRNVLIYFGDRTVKGVIKRLSGALRPGGALFVGVSESLLRFGTALSCEERDGVFFYRNAE